MIGKLREPIELLAPDHIADGAGGVQHQWQVIGLVWAQVQSTQDSREENSLRSIAQHNYRFKIRAHIYINYCMRIGYKNTHYEILSLRETSQKGRFLEILAREVTA